VIVPVAPVAGRRSCARAAVANSSLAALISRAPGSRCLIGRNADERSDCRALNGAAGANKSTIGI